MELLTLFLIESTPADSHNNQGNRLRKIVEKNCIYQKKRERLKRKVMMNEEQKINESLIQYVNQKVNFRKWNKNNAQ